MYTQQELEMFDQYDVESRMDSLETLFANMQSRGQGIPIKKSSLYFQLRDRRAELVEEGKWEQR